MVDSSLSVGELFTVSKYNVIENSGFVGGANENHIRLFICPVFWEPVIKSLYFTTPSQSLRECQHFIAGLSTTLRVKNICSQYAKIWLSDTNGNPTVAVESLIKAMVRCKRNMVANA